MSQQFFRPKGVNFGHGQIDLAAVDQVVERSQSHVDRRSGVNQMDKLEVDIIGSESPHAFVDLSHDVDP